MAWPDILSLLTALGVGGVIGGVVTHYSRWTVEKTRMRVAYRRELIKSWRTELLPSIPDSEDENRPDGAPQYDFMRTPQYASIRGHLNIEFVRRLEGNSRTVVVTNASWPRTEFMEEISRIEREWKLH